MDVSRYEFGCQKALHQGLQYARSLGHQLLEVEHVALAMLRADAVTLKGQLGDRMKRHLEAHLARSPRVYGTIKVEFGRRLDAALDLAEAQATTTLVKETVLWEALCRQSTIIQSFLTRSAEAAEERSKADEDFSPMVGKRAAGDGSPTPNPGKSSSSANSKAKAKAGSKVAAENPVPDKLGKDLRLFTVDLSASAERGELDPVIGRDAEVRRVLEILGRKKKNNPILIGEPGVGKSAVAEAIALRIASGAVPESMRGMRVLSLDLGAMLAGAKFRGEFEERMKNLLKALEALRGQVILFIDEIHMLVGAGNHEGGADAANLLKPALARGELQCLGATTLDEFRKYIEKDPALERRFQPIMVEEPNAQTTLAILRGLKSRYEIHHKVQIDDEALRAAVAQSIRYLPNRKLPDKAIDLIDEAASRLHLQIESVPAILDQLKSEIGENEIERKAIGTDSAGHKAALAQLAVRLDKAKIEYARIESIWRRHQDLLAKLHQAEKSRQEGLDLYETAKSQSDFDFAARLQYGELPRLGGESAHLKAALAQMQKEHAFLRQVVGAREIAEVVSVWTRIPVGRLLEDDMRKLLDLEARLAKRVFGQDQALAKIARTLKRARVGINDPGRPLGVFLFLGPTGVGKTETAKALAAELFADDAKIIRIDMSEFMEQHAAARLVGSPPGYVGFGEGGELTEAVRHKPYSVVLFDEVEKSHPRVLDLLLQTFEDGRLTDGSGRLVDFRNTLIIMTSNLALQRIADPEAASEQALRDSLALQLRPEFVNRIDEVVVFKRLGRPQLSHLLERLLGELNGRLSDRLFRVGIGPNLTQKLIASAQGSAFGGRALRRTFETQVVDAVATRLLTHPGLGHGAWDVETLDDDVVRWRLQHRPGYYLR
jgi:ATP-dependent Clp protease ATP-binding subunit ClpB